MLGGFGGGDSGWGMVFFRKRKCFFGMRYSGIFGRIEVGRLYVIGLGRREMWGFSFIVMFSLRFLGCFGCVFF